ncbi:conserved hypothetical protein [Klebsiella variicola]|nr:conserved hypothetical protein [Klebsiella variicola]
MPPCPMSLPGGAALTRPTESARYGMAPENYGLAAGPIPAEIGEPEVGRQGLAATEGGQRRFEQRERKIPPHPNPTPLPQGEGTVLQSLWRRAYPRRCAHSRIR